MTTEDRLPGGDFVAELLGGLRETVLAEGSRVESVIVDVDVDLDALLASLPAAETASADAAAP